jgi:hypothetical protein
MLKYAAVRQIWRFSTLYRQILGSLLLANWLYNRHHLPLYHYHE